MISYDRLVLGAPVDYYVSFDNERVGELQAETLLEKLKEEGSPKGPIVMINGSPTDPNAAQFKAGATKVFEKEGTNVAKEYDTPEWSPDQAQNEMEQAITALGKNGFAAVYAANDGTAGGAIAAMKSAGIEPESKPTTGQDAELEAIQRILVGEQFMTVYKAITPEANDAAEMAVALAEGKEIPSGLVNGKERQRSRRSALGPAQTGGGEERKHQRNNRQGRILADVGNLHRPLQGRLQRSRHRIERG